MAEIPLDQVTKKQKLSIHPVENIHCKNCKELLLKIYPNGRIAIAPGFRMAIICVKCNNKNL